MTESNPLEALNLGFVILNNSRTFCGVDSMQVGDCFRYFVISCVSKFLGITPDLIL